jgi:uncharacterized Zn-binding protein involved in type VI secretion
MAFAATQGDLTNTLFGPPGVGQSISPTVLIQGRPALTVGSPVTIHGNPFNPHAPGFNPPCAAAVIIDGSTTVLVEGKPLARFGSFCSCGLHHMEIVAATTVLVGE